MKKACLIFIFLLSVSTNVFSEGFGTLDFGYFLGANMYMFNLPKVRSEGGNGFYTFIVGFTFDFYLLDWLFIDTGLLFSGGRLSYIRSFQGEASQAENVYYLDIPLAVHMNVPIPYLKWIYGGAGLMGHVLIHSNNVEDYKPLKEAPCSYLDWFVDVGIDFRSRLFGGPRLISRVSTALIPFNDGTYPQGGINDRRGVVVGIFLQFHWHIN